MDKEFIEKQFVDEFIDQFITLGSMEFG